MVTDAELREASQAGISVIKLRERNAARSGSPTTVEANIPHPNHWPVKIVLPWSTLVSDNDRLGVMNGQKIKTKVAREAMKRIRSIAESAVPEGFRAAAYPVALEAKVYFPRNSAVGDAPNFAKHVHDSLEGIVYQNDRWLYDARWRRAGSDIDHPRAEITITLLAP